MSDNSPNNQFSGPALIIVIGILSLVALIIYSSYTGYLYIAEDVLNWDQRSTYTVGMSFLLILYGLLLVRTLIGGKPKDSALPIDDQTKEKNDLKDRMKPISALSISAVMIFLLGWILFKNKDVWHLPPQIGLALVSSSCFFLIAADYLQYKINGQKKFLFLIPLWMVVFLIFLAKILNGADSF